MDTHIYIHISIYVFPNFLYSRYNRLKILDHKLNQPINSSTRYDPSLCSPLIHLHSQFIYIHKMIPNKHHQLATTNSKHKHQYRHALCEAHFVQEAIHVDVASRMLYCFKGFEKCPHGSSEVEDRDKHDLILKLSGNELKGASIHNITYDQIKNNENDNIKVCYPGSFEIYKFECLKLHHNEWLEFVLHNGSSSISRDPKLSGVSSRITLGFTPKQPTTHPKTSYYKNTLKPYSSFPEFGRNKIMLPKKLRRQLAKIISLGQEMVDELYKEDKPMQDHERTAIFGAKFGKSFHPLCSGRFEFVDILVKCESHLNRHLDYKNDHRSGYNHGCSYSYLVKRTCDAKIYRVNFIMCTRLVCGAFMDEIRMNE